VLKSAAEQAFYTTRFNFFENYLYYHLFSLFLSLSLSLSSSPCDSARSNTI